MFRKFTILMSVIGAVSLGTMVIEPTTVRADDDYDDYWEDYWDDVEDAQKRARKAHRRAMRDRDDFYKDRFDRDRRYYRSYGPIYYGVPHDRYRGYYHQPGVSVQFGTWR